MEVLRRQISKFIKQKEDMSKTIEELQEEVDRLKKWNKWFFDRVSFMRYSQKEYFKTRDHKALQKSKAVETEIDNEINRIQAILIKQQEPTNKLVEAFNLQPVYEEPSLF